MSGFKEEGVIGSYTLLGLVFMLMFVGVNIFSKWVVNVIADKLEDHEPKRNPKRRFYEKDKGE